MKSHNIVGRTGILLILLFLFLLPLGCSSLSPFKKNSDQYNTGSKKASVFHNPFSKKDKQPKQQKKETFSTPGEFLGAKRP